MTIQGAGKITKRDVWHTVTAQLMAGLIVVLTLPSVALDDLKKYFFFSSLGFPTCTLEVGFGDALIQLKNIS